MKISAKDLSMFNNIAEELKQNPLYYDYDISTLQFIILKKKTPPKINDIEKVLADFERYITINKNLIPKFEGEEIILKKDLARMLGISRPTLDKWIECGFIERGYSQKLGREYYKSYEVLEQLKKISNKK